MEERGENPVIDGENPVSLRTFLSDSQHKILEAFSFARNFVRPYLQRRAGAFGTYRIAAYQYSSLFVGVRIAPVAEVADYFVFTCSRIDNIHFDHPFLGEGFSPHDDGGADGFLA